MLRPTGRSDQRPTESPTSLATAARIGGWAILDQAIVAGTRFGLGIVLARYALELEYGAYLLAFSAMQFLSGFQTALIGRPMSVLGASKKGDEFQQYVSTFLVAQLLLGVLTAVVAAAIGLSLLLFTDQQSVATSLLAGAAAIVFIQMQELIRRVLFCRIAISRVLLNDTLYCLSQGIGLGVLLYLDTRIIGDEWLTGAMIFMVIGAAAAVAASLGLLQIRPYLARSLDGARDFIAEHWRFGPWVVVEVFGVTALFYGNNLLLGMIVGAAEVSSLEAPRLLLAPLQIVAAGVGSVLLPVMSRKYTALGSKGLASVALPVTAAVSIAFLIYALVIAVFPAFWLELLFGEKYSDCSTLVQAWAGSYFLMGLRVVPTSMLIAMRRPDLTMYASLASGGLLMISAVPLVWFYHAEGAVAARLLSDFAMLVIVVIFIRRALATGRAPERTA